MGRLWTLAFCLSGLLGQARAAEIPIHDDASQPESLAAAGNGDLFVGSAGSPFIYRIGKGTGIAERYIDARAEGPGTFFFGIVADDATQTLWACQLTPVPDTTPLRRRTSVRGFDLATGAETLRWPLPGETSMCNDFAIGPDKALYITDTANAKIYRWAAGARRPDLFLENRLLSGVDGISFLDGVLYVTNVAFNKLYRIPVDASGKPGTPVDIWMDAPVRGPDGMRAAGGRLFVAEAQHGRVVAITVSGDTAHVVPLKDGLKTPTGIAPSGDTLWFTERGAGRIASVPIAQ